MAHVCPNTAEFFALLGAAVDEVGPSLTRKVKGRIKVDILDAGAWLVDLKNGTGSVKRATASDKADVTILLSEETFMKMMDNKLNPQQALMNGLVKIKGNMRLAMKLNVVQAATRNYMKKKNASDKPAPVASSIAIGKPNSEEIFRLLGDVVAKNGAAMSEKVKGIIQFDVTGAGNWNLDLKSATPALVKGSKQADVIITVADADFVAIALGNLHAQQAFMKGKLNFKGNMLLAMRLPVVFNALQPQSKL